MLFGCNNNNHELQKISQEDPKNNISPMKKVTGIGGIFFKCKDTEKMKNWYSKNLGMKTDGYGSLFEFRSADEPYRKEFLQWSPFSEKTKYFEPSEKEFMRCNFYEI